MTNIEAIVDAPDELRELGLHEGDRVEGLVRNGRIVLMVTVDDTSKKTASDIGFGSRWRGKFKELKELDFSDDPRAQRILSH